MESYQLLKNEAAPKKTKKENARGVISKSLQKNRNANYLNASPKSSGGVEIVF